MVNNYGLLFVETNLRVVNLGFRRNTKNNNDSYYNIMITTTTFDKRQTDSYRPDVMTFSKKSRASLSYVQYHYYLLMRRDRHIHYLYSAPSTKALTFYAIAHKITTTTYICYRSKVPSYLSYIPTIYQTHNISTYNI